MKLKLTFCIALVAAVAIFALADDFKTGNLYIPGPYKLIFGSGLASDVTLTQSAANTLSVDSGNTLAVTTADKLTVGGVIIPQYIVASFVDGATGSATDRSFFIAPAAYQVAACYQVHSVAAGGTSTLEVVKDTGTSAPGAGTDLLQTSGFNLNATANTLQTGTLSATVSDLQLAAGDRLAVDYANAIQSSAGVAVTCQLKRI